jgi:tryptophan-rich sensory protein
MALSKLLFPVIRALQVMTLIPIWGMLAYFVHKFRKQHTDAPVEILILFITALIATGWAIVSFFQFHRSRTISLIVFVMDMLIYGTFVAGVVLLRYVKDSDCAAFSAPVGGKWGDHDWSWDNGSGWDVSFKKSCMLLKASWILAIVDTVLFFISSIVALMIYHRNETCAVREKTYVVDHRRPTGRRRRWF